LTKFSFVRAYVLFLIKWCDYQEERMKKTLYTQKGWHGPNLVVEKKKEIVFFFSKINLFIYLFLIN